MKILCVFKKVDETLTRALPRHLVTRQQSTSAENSARAAQRQALLAKFQTEVPNASGGVSRQRGGCCAFTEAFETVSDTALVRRFGLVSIL